MADEKRGPGRPKGPGRPRKEEPPKPIKQLEDYPPVLYASEVAELFRMSRGRVYQLTREGTFKALKGIGRTRKYEKRLLPLELIGGEPASREQVPCTAVCAGGR